MRNKKYIFDMISFFSFIIPPLAALSTGILDLIPGVLLTLFSWFFSNYSWLLLLYPPLLSFRGTLGGIYSGRLSTSLHLGNMLPSILNNSEEYYTLLAVISILYLIGTLILIFTIGLVSVLVLGYEIWIINDILLIFLSTFFLTQITMFPLVTLIAKFSYLKGWNPDIITYPFTSSLGDIAITSFFLLASYSIILSNNYLLAIGLSAGNFLLPLLFYLFGFDIELFISELKESLMAIILVSIIVNITGYLFKELSFYLKINPILYFIYPAILTSIGDGGSIVGSTSTTSLALIGHLNWNKLLRENVPTIIFLVSMIFPLYGLSGYIIFQDSINAMFLIRIALVGILSIFIVSIISVSTALLTYKRGLDPDHFVTPIESTLADGVTTFIIYILFTFH